MHSIPFLTLCHYYAFGAQNPQMDFQAMDTCHRIGQTKPVHVYRLAIALSFEGWMLKRAFSKLRLEHVVIGKGQFHQERIKNNEVLDVCIFFFFLK
ncbi:putative DNA helicase [Helianthus annuus]|uniref:Putative P-loop containing nucleoside triphosphate hydrolase n=1 Tax=Helianthus annuus TaxID=4232 RepID=A0A251UNK0_HELAN|nr:putative DNA helicase [Helianthus annuus]